MDERIRIGFNTPEDMVIKQMEDCLTDDSVAAIMGDSHYGYKIPVVGVIAYSQHVSPSAVGFDIACGIKAVKTDIKLSSINNLRQVLKDIRSQVSFGVGRINNETVEHEVLEKISNAVFIPQRELAGLASRQLGTVGSGNHFVDLLVDEDDNLWISCHFGSRGFGHKTAMGFVAIAQGKSFEDGVAGKVSEGSMDGKPLLFDIATEDAHNYINAMNLAGEYAYAGRDWVISKVLNILGASSVYEVHNHHNFAWEEEHDGVKYWVHRKGATPSFPGQLGFVGSSMGTPSVIIKGLENESNRLALYSAMHGAGRIMSRSKAAGKIKWKGGKAVHSGGGLIDWDQVMKDMTEQGVIVLGAGADEAPGVYKDLNTVIASHTNIEVVQTLKPVGVIMAGNEYDPYKD
jgi:tRNA-splicing ligase RtcB (3'-phosphate/5'-hydroxy nucleic acid ligase)